nr:acyl-coenzyme A thioesterase 1 [Peromyscus maniculatus bairdii]
MFSSVSSPEPGPYPGIVDLFGVGGGLLEYRASLLAGKGFAVMALAYYNYDDLPKGMETMRIEYFEEAVNYLLSHPEHGEQQVEGQVGSQEAEEVKGPGVGLLGISKGGELGLAMASFLKGIKAAVIINGSVAAVGNTIYYKDETIPPVSLLRNRVRMTKDGLMDVVEGLQSPLVEQKSFIPVERSDTTFLFIVGQDDHNWKSEFYANEISKRLQAHGKEKPQIICYPEAGHYIEPPYFPLCKAGMHLLRDVRTPFVVELEVLDGHEPDGGRLLARAVHERHFMAPGVRRVPVREGRVRATLFLPPEPGPFPGIVDLFGVGGGLLEYRASLLAGKGFAVLALAYYNYDDLPKGMDAMHMEYFEEAVNYLLSHPEIKGPGVGVLGISKGGELGLAMASFLKGIKAAVIINGSVAAVGNTINYKDEAIPPVSILRNQVRMTKDGLQDVVDALQSPLVEQKSFIPVERADTTFLLIVGQDDHNWKSEFYANEISKRLQAHGKEKPQIICYPEAGHYIEPPYFPLCKAGMHLLVGANITFGGEPKPHAMAQLDAWQQLQTFFHKHLSGKS